MRKIFCLFLLLLLAAFCITACRPQTADSAAWGTGTQEDTSEHMSPSAGDGTTGDVTGSHGSDNGPGTESRPETTAAPLTDDVSTSAVTEPMATEPAATTPTVTDPAKTEPTETKPEETEPEETEPIPHDGTNWMTALPDGMPLSMLSIPGTHDSGARLEPLSGTAQCQTLTIAEQLQAGVRYLDIRCKRVNGVLKIYHGVADQKLTFQEVLTQVYGFLDAHPGETVLMCIKEEDEPSGNNPSFDAMVRAFTEEAPQRWYLKNNIPLLGEARGRIVLMRRFSTGSAMGFDASSGWSDNTTFTLTTGSWRLSVQDRYQVADGSEKWQAVHDFLDGMIPAVNQYYLNNLSGYQAGWFGIPNIPAISRDVLPRFLEYLNTAPAFVGITAMDFVTEELANGIFELNFAK